MSRGIAIVRPPADTLGECQLTHQGRRPIDCDKARAEHADYCRLLAAAGYDLVVLEADRRFPDGVFVEDTAVVLRGLALICRPGAPSRRGETQDVAGVLADHRPLARVEAPATLDGGDVLVVGDRVFVGRSSRTNDAGALAVRRIASGHGYAVTVVAVSGALHLKTAVTAVDDETLLVNPAWVDRSAFAGLEVLTIDPAEPTAANVLRLGDAVVMNAECPRTIAIVIARGHRVIDQGLGELAKAEAGLTCSSLLVGEPIS